MLSGQTQVDFQSQPKGNRSIGQKSKNLFETKMFDIFTLQQNTKSKRCQKVQKTDKEVIFEEHHLNLLAGVG